MKELTKQEITARRRANHYFWLIALGADQDEAQKGITYRKLRLLERRLDRVNTAACNGELPFDEASDSYPDQERAINQATAQIAQLFGGSVPDGFFVNRDPRGYALKINDSAMEDYLPDLRNRGINPERDWGGFGILAPDFN